MGPLLILWVLCYYGSFAIMGPLLLWVLCECDFCDYGSFADETFANGTFAIMGPLLMRPLRMGPLLLWDLCYYGTFTVLRPLLILWDLHHYETVAHIMGPLPLWDLC
jgi:hypothetical protein